MLFGVPLSFSLLIILGGVLILPVLTQDQNVFRSDKRLVEVEVFVRDAKGPVCG
jgi:hypothetical protein